MHAFETWQVCLSGATLIAAICIGWRQIKISSQQAKISEKQTQISKSLLDIPFTVSVDLIYDQNLQQLHIYNKSQTNIFFGEQN